jgi:alpha-galactosidase
MWSMLSAPLLIGCDMTKLDSLTRQILTNDEVIAIDQDPLGKPARQVVAYPNEGGEVWARPLSDGATAVALINPGSIPQSVSVTWTQLGLTGARKIRDLWLHQDVTADPNGYKVLVPVHGIVLIKVWPAKS